MLTSEYPSASAEVHFPIASSQAQWIFSFNPHLCKTGSSAVGGADSIVHLWDKAIQKYSLLNNLQKEERTFVDVLSKAILQFPEAVACGNVVSKRAMWKSIQEIAIGLEALCNVECNV